MKLPWFALLAVAACGSSPEPKSPEAAPPPAPSASAPELTPAAIPTATAAPLPGACRMTVAVTGMT